MEKLRKDLEIIAGFVTGGTKVLDIGCCDGQLLTYLKSIKHCDARGIEIDQKQVSTCVKKGLSVIQGDADKDLIHYPDKSFDYVISSQMLQATYKPYEVLQQMLRIGKQVVVSIPNFGHWQNRLYLTFKGRMPVTSALAYQWYETPNIHFCTVRDFVALCHDIGAVVVKKKYVTNGKTLSTKTLPFANLFCNKAVFLLEG